MELVYLWVDSYKNIKEEGFDFSPKFECSYFKESNSLTIEPKKHIENFFDKKENINFFNPKRIHFDIKAKSIKYETKVNENIKTFNLKNLYEEHKDIISELLQKRMIYNDSYIDELMQNYEGTIFKNREDLMRLITCGYMNDEDINKRPLSKLIKDISEELGLI